MWLVKIDSNTHRYRKQYSELFIQEFSGEILLTQKVTVMMIKTDVKDACEGL